MYIIVKFTSEKLSLLFFFTMVGLRFFDKMNANWKRLRITDLLFFSRPGQFRVETSPAVVSRTFDPVMVQAFSLQLLSQSDNGF
jgi:hypothetical protein